MPGVKDMDPVHSFRLSRFCGERFLTLSDQWWKKLCYEISWIEKLGW